MKYKSFKISLALASGLLLLSGCGDALDITPDGRMTQTDVFNNIDYTESYVNSMYEGIRKYGINYHYYTFHAAYEDDGTDSQVPTDSWQQLQYWNQGSCTSSTNRPFSQGKTGLRYNDMDFWETAYGGIRKTNIFLANANEKNIPEVAKLGRYRAEAKVLRAHYYFDLMKNYGGVPLFDTDITLKQDFTDVKRATYQQCTDFVVKDCDDAIAEPNLPFRTTEEGERGRMTKAIAHFIKASVLLFNASPLWNPEGDQAKWARAAKACKEAVDALEANGYELFPDYETYFITRPDKAQMPADKETILEAIDSWGYGNQTYRAFGVMMFLMNEIPTFPSEKCGLCPSQELVDTYEMANGEVPIEGYKDERHTQPIINPAAGYDDQNPYVNRDPRFYASIWYNGAHFGMVKDKDVYIESYVGGAHGMAGIKQRSPTGYYLRKYVDKTMRVTGASKTLYRIYRFGELYLSLAEAENEANGPTAIAYAAVNKVRHRAGMPDLPTGLSKEEFRERIRRERRVELALEENRFYDIRRWKILPEVSKFKTGMRWVKDDAGNLKQTRVVAVDCQPTADEKYYLLPIPLSEILRMPNVEQNPKW